VQLGMACRRCGDDRERDAWAENPRMDNPEEDGEAQAVVRDRVAMGARDAGDHGVEPKAPEVVGHRAGRHGRWTSTLQGSQLLPEHAVAETSRHKSKGHQRIQ